MNTDTGDASLKEQPEPPENLVWLDDEQTKRLRILNPHGWNSPKAGCRTCSKEANGRYRWYLSGTRDPNQIVTYRCDCASQFRLYRWMAWAGIGLNYMRVDWWDALDMDDALIHAALNYAINGPYHANAGNNLVLYSQQPGTGKTFLASLIAKRLLKDGLDVYFTTFTAMLDLYSASWHQDEERRYFDERVRGAQILVVDDLGREYSGRFPVAIALLESVLRSRIANCQPTIVTTNLAEDELVAYGDNTVSLLAERMITLKVTGSDKRPAMTTRTSTEHGLGLKRPIVIS